MDSDRLIGYNDEAELYALADNEEIGYVKLLKSGKKGPKMSVASILSHGDWTFVGDDKTLTENEKRNPIRYKIISLGNKIHGIAYEDDETIQNVEKLFIFGGQGSGNFGHKGRPGQVGGSSDDGISNVPQKSRPTETKDKSLEEQYPQANPNGKDTMEKFMNPDGTWTAERQALHDKIVEDAFTGKTPVDDPISYILGGGPAAGKTTILRSGNVNIPENTVLAAGDDIKLLLPEYEEGLKSGNSTVAQFVHEESSYLSKRIAAKAAKEKYNLVMDGTGDSGIDSLSKKVNSMRASGQPLIGIYATIDIETAKQRSILRAQKTGRYVPESVLVANHKAISKIFPDIVSNEIMDQIQLYDTSSSPPKLIAIGANGKLDIKDKDAYDAFIAKGDYK